MSCSMDDNMKINAESYVTTSTSDGLVNAFYSTMPQHESLTGWTYWRDYYYPTVIRESYPVYIKERAVDKGKQAFEVLKTLQDKKLLNIEKVGDFIEAMDALIKIL